MLRPRKFAQQVVPTRALLAPVVCTVLLACTSFVTPVDAEPILVRSLYRANIEAAGSGTPAELAARIDSMNPADCYVVAHIGYWEPVVQALVDRGKRIVRYVNPTTVRDGSSGMRHTSAERLMWDAFVETGRVLKDGDRVLRYRYFGEPYILAWDQLTTTEVDRLAARFAFVPADGWELDLWFPRLRPWMLEDRTYTQAQLDGLYDRLAWQANRDRFLEQLVANPEGVDRDRLLILNGSSEHWYDQGRLVFFENATAREWDDALSRWRARPGCILEVRQPSGEATQAQSRVVWERIIAGIRIWLQDGSHSDSWLWIDNGTPEATQAHLLAWNWKQWELR